MTEPLRIDTGLVLEAGGRLQSLAAAIPPPPAPYRPGGADALSAAIAAKVAEVVDPVIAQLPVTKEELMRYAQNVVTAAGTYEGTDRQLAEEILKRLNAFDETAGAGGTGSGGSSGATTTAAGGASAASGAAAPAAGAAQQAGQMGPMMQMPMQMVQQAAQAPMQMGGMVGAVPQAMGQAVQSAVQQVSELAGQAEDAGAAPDAREAPSQDQATAGTSSGERVPENDSTPTRVAESSPETTL
jgi:hypothetical protein